MMRDLAFRTSDYDLFGQDMSPTEYEFFKKHTGAFKSLLEDQSKEKKQEFVDTFKVFSLHHGCLKDCPTKNDSRVSYLDEITSIYKDNFVNGKFSTAKNIVMDAVTLAQNKHLLQYMGAKSYSKDPFFHKETRDVFRRLFGLPSLNGTFIKVICVLPLHIKFGGSICRYLRRWMDADPVKSLPSINSEAKKTSKTTSKKREKEAKEQVPKRCDFDQFEMYIREVFNYDTSRYDFTEFRKALESIDFNSLKNDSSGSVAEEKPPKKTEDEVKKTAEIPGDEGLSLSEYLGVVNKDDRAMATKSDGIVPAESNSKYLPSGSSDSSKSKPNEEMMSYMAYNLDGKVNIVRGTLMEEYKSPMDFVDESYEEIQKMLLLNKPHPNEQFEQLLGKKLSKENELKLIQCKENIKKQIAQHEAELKWSGDEPANTTPTEACSQEMTKKRHACANCRKVEPEPKTFKKCQRCRGKGTRFYCSKLCQETDWVVCHREDHNSIEDVT